MLVSQLKPAADANQLLATKLRTLVIEQGLIADSPVADTLTQSLLATLITSTTLMWEAASERGLLAQESEATCINTRILSDELNALRAELSEQVILSPAEFRAYEKFLGNYRDTVGSSFRYITHPSFTDNSPIQFDDLYVAANFLEYNDFFSAGDHDQRTRLSRGEAELLTPTEVLGISFRTVILGNPGAGKSTFAVKLCHDLWKYPAESVLGGRVLIPVLIILRDYAKTRKEHPSSIIEYIEQRAKADYQQAPPQNAFHRLFLTGRALVIFDGLDELLDTADRLEIKNAVERFSNVYPSVAILVTSREVGYEQAPLDPVLFSVFKILPFDDVTFQELIADQGPIAVFAARQVAYRPSHYVSIGSNLYWHLIGAPDPRHQVTAIAKPLVDSLVELSTPWKTSSLGQDFDRIKIGSFYRLEETELRWPDDAYGRSAVALLSAVYGTTGRAPKIAPAFATLLQLHSVRKEISKSKGKIGSGQVDVLVEALELVPVVTDIMKSWAKGEIELHDGILLSEEDIVDEVQKSLEL